MLGGNRLHVVLLSDVGGTRGRNHERTVGCHSDRDRTVQFADEVLDLIDDFVPGVKTRIIAEQLVRRATSRAATIERLNVPVPGPSSPLICLSCLKKPTNPNFGSNASKRLSRQLERVREAIASADEIIAMTFSSRRTAQTGATSYHRVKR